MKKFISTEPDQYREHVESRLSALEEKVAETVYVLTHLPGSFQTAQHLQLAEDLKTAVVRFRALLTPKP